MEVYEKADGRTIRLIGDVKGIFVQATVPFAFFTRIVIPREGNTIVP
jgi:hypothetical protein